VWRAAPKAEGLQALPGIPEVLEQCLPHVMLQDCGIGPHWSNYLRPGHPLFHGDMLAAEAIRLYTTELYCIQ
jgi:hypothetical protein